MLVTKEIFGRTRSGETVYKFTLCAASGVRVSLGEIGGAILEYWVPGKDGVFRDIALGYDRLEDYEDNLAYFGSLLGRCISHPAGETLHFDGKDYPLALGPEGVHMHGGAIGFSRAHWHGEPDGTDGVVFTLYSPEGDEGYPGDVDAWVRYSLSEEGALRIAYDMKTSSRTVVNPSNHAHMNLNGHNGRDVGNHTLQIPAVGLFDLDQEELMPLAAGSDLRRPRLLDEVFKADDEEIRLYNGLDHMFRLEGSGWKLAARAACADSGIELSCWTDLPAIMVMTGGSFDGSYVGKGGYPYPVHSCIAFETMLQCGNRQIDDISPVIDPEHPYHSETCFVPRVLP